MEQKRSAAEKNETQIPEEIPKEIPESPFLKAIKRILLITTGLFLVYLMLSYVGVGEYMLNIFEGQLTSSLLEANNTFILENKTTIQFSEEVYEQLFHLYITSQEHEFAACLYGNYSKNENGEKTYLLTSLMQPKTYRETFNQVISSGCDADAFIFLHSHPYKHCLFSEQDLQTHKSFAAKNPVGLSAIMCEEERFTFYGY